MLPKLGEAFSHPLRLSWCKRTPTCMLILTAIYGFSLLIYHYTIMYTAETYRYRCIF